MVLCFLLAVDADSAVMVRNPSISFQVDREEREEREMWTEQPSQAGLAIKFNPYDKTLK